MSVDDPVASLALADAASRRLAGRARWTSWCYLTLAALWPGVLLVAGVASPVALDGRGAVVVGLVLFGVISLVNAWADRRGVVVRGSRRLRGVSQGATAALYLGSLVLGTVRFRGEPGFWIPAAVLVAIPSLVVAVLAGRSADPR